MRVLLVDLPRELSHSLRGWRRDLFRAACAEGAAYRHHDLNFSFWSWVLRAQSVDGFARLGDLLHQTTEANQQLLAHCAERISAFSVPGGVLQSTGLALESALQDHSDALSTWTQDRAVHAALAPWFQLLAQELLAADVLCFSVGSPGELAFAGAIAAHMREIKGEAHACLIHHRWENFSLAPRLAELLEPGALLQMFDSVVLAEEAAGPALQGLLSSLREGRLDQLQNIATRIDGRTKVLRSHGVGQDDAYPLLDGSAEEEAIHDWLLATGLPARQLLVFEALVRNDCHYGKCTFCVQNDGYLGHQHHKTKLELARSLPLIRHLATRHAVRSFSFTDQAVHPNLLSSIVPDLGEIPGGVNWCLRVIPDYVPAPELLSQAARAGCRNILLGLESTHPTTLRQMGKVHGFSGEAAHRWIDHCRAEGVGVTLSAISHFPSESDSEFAQTTGAFLNEVKHRHPNVAVILNHFILYRGSRLALAGAANGIADIQAPAGDLQWVLDYTDVHGRGSEPTVASATAFKQLCTHLRYGSIGLLAEWAAQADDVGLWDALSNPPPPGPARAELSAATRWRLSRDVLVTGASGFLGHYVVNGLAGRVGSERLLLSSGHVALSPHANAPHLKEDLSRSADQLAQESPAEVWFCARPDTASFPVQAAFNFHAQCLFDQWARRGHLRRLVYFSTQLVAGTPGDGERSEGASPLEPECAYGTAKAQLEVFAGYLARASGISVDVVRLPLLFDPRGTQVPGLKKQFMHQWREQLQAGERWQFDGPPDLLWGNSWADPTDVVQALLQDRGPGLRTRGARSGDFTYAQLQALWGGGAVAASPGRPMHLPQTRFFLADELGLAAQDLSAAPVVQPWGIRSPDRVNLPLSAPAPLVQKVSR